MIFKKKKQKNDLNARAGNLKDVQAEHDDVVKRLEQLRQDGQENTWEYQKLWKRKFQLVEQINAYDRYGFL